MPASFEEVNRAVEEGVVIKNGYGVSRLLYEGDTIRGMELVACVSVRDADGRFNPTYDRNAKLVVEADSVLMAAGQKVDLSFIEEKYALALNRGLIKVEEGTQKTSRSGVFAGGDATTGPSTVVMAIRTGRNAAEAIVKELGGEGNGRYVPDGFLTFDVDGAKNTTPVKAEELPAAQRALDTEDSFTISEEACLGEAKRCMNCGCYSVNASDISPVLIALDAEIVTTKKVLKASDFFTTKLAAYDMLDPDELVTAIRFDIPEGYRMTYDKFRVRKAIDFAIVSLAALYKLEKGVITDARIVLGGVAPVPLRKKDVEAVLIGQKPSPELGEQAGDVAVREAVVMKDNAYKKQEVKALLKRLIGAMA
jgi:CO/xanthine dehydrogenase FAD-binding subunit